MVGVSPTITFTAFIVLLCDFFTGRVTMKLSKVLLDLGTSALSTINPIAGAGVKTLVNMFLDTDDQISDQTTGQDILNRINLLPEGDKQKLLSQNVELEIQLSQERINANDNSVAVAKLLSNNTTANEIVSQAAKTVQRAITLYGVLLLAIAVCQLIALVTGDDISIDRINAIKGVIPSWETVATMLGVPTIIIYRFLGVQSQDNRTLSNSMNGFRNHSTSESIKSMVTSIRAPKK